MESFLEKIQDAITRHLNTSQGFEEVPVVSHQDNDLEGCLKEWAHSGVGLCIVVLNPLPVRIVPGKHQLSFQEMNIRVQIIENPCTKRSELNALNLAECVSRVLHHYKPEIDFWEGWLEINTNHPWKEIKDPQKMGRYLLEVHFTVQGAIKEKGVVNA